ncbi:MAG: DUF2239 family protein [Burkholderiaceae bacterium]|nr:DUF2239 family protein [Burkholderiaceae bacterium]
MVCAKTPCTAFAGSRCIATGVLQDVALMAKNAIDDATLNSSAAPVLIFNDATSEVIELDWRGSVAEFQARLAQLPASDTDTSASPNQEASLSDDEQANVTKGPGRPKLGVVAREVTLLPRHWEWLASQTGGASVALRKLVEVARRTSAVKDRVQRASAVGYKFMSTMAGHEPGFEEASRALFAGDQAGFEAVTATWPLDVQAHLKKLLADAFWA